ncbi:hypothetical protein [Listeria grandensis]|uniref:hypothetical protein n=1 Tax=Listeria grandensis TaxID=1494963 RepID=UPI00164E0603|nr:hypothetical protein [Listeria grandensis]MBC6314477.1 hypothetical protein [Listeria grandensis]
MKKVFAFTSFMLGLSGIFLLEILDLFQRNLITVSTQSSEDFDNVNFLGGILTIPIMLIVLGVVFIWWDYKTKK